MIDKTVPYYPEIKDLEENEYHILSTYVRKKKNGKWYAQLFMRSYCFTNMDSEKRKNISLLMLKTMIIEIERSRLFGFIPESDFFTNNSKWIEVDENQDSEHLRNIKRDPFLFKNGLFCRPDTITDEDFNIVNKYLNEQNTIR